MKSKTAKNRKKNRRKKRNAPNKAEDIWRNNTEQETLDSLDPIKNATDQNLFVFDPALPYGRNKLVRDKTTWAERKLTSRRLGLVLPKHTGKTFQEKRKLSEAEKKVIDGKVKRLKKGDEEVKEDGAEVNGKDEDDVEEVKDESMQEETEEKKSIIVVERAKTKVDANGTTKKTSTQVYDIWGPTPEPPKNPKHSFIEEVINPKQKEWVAKPVESKLPAVPMPHDAESYHPVPEVHEAMKEANTKISNMLSKQAEESTALQKRLAKNKKYFPRIDTNDAEVEEEGGEEAEQIREVPKRHKTSKELKKKSIKKIIRNNKEREEEIKRKQRDIYRIPDIIEGIEAEDKARDEKRVKKLSTRERRVNMPRSTDGRKIKQPAMVTIAGGSTRLRSINAVVNPMKDRLLSMQNRGLMLVKNVKRDPKPMFKLVEPEHVKEFMREAEEKYLRPVLEKEIQKLQKANKRQKKQTSV